MTTWARAALATLAALWGIGEVAPNDLETHKQLKWNGPGGCLVEFVNTPCRTVRSHEFSFGIGLGFDGIAKAESVEAVDWDGSESKTRTTSRRRYWLTENRDRITELVLRTKNRTVYIDHERRIFEVQDGRANRGYQAWEEDDAQCSHAASHYVYLSERIPNSVVAGIEVVGYGGRDARGADNIICFAPSIGCQVMRFETVKKGFLGWTTAKYEWVVDVYEIGQPSPSLFTPPSGYKQVPSIPDRW
jgi:hypothetical protein